MSKKNKTLDSISVNYVDLTPEEKKVFVKAEIERKRKFFRAEKTTYKNFPY